MINRRLLLPGGRQPYGIGGNAGPFSGVFHAGASSNINIADGSLSYTLAKFAISTWVSQRDAGAVSRSICGHGVSGGDIAFSALFDTSDRLSFRSYNDGTNINGNITTTATYTSLSSWHHLLLHFDSANATAGDRMKMWWDGSEVTAFDVDNNPSGAVFNSTGNIMWGRSTTGYGDLLLYQPTIFDNVLPAVTDLRTSGGAPISPLGQSGVASSIVFLQDGTAFDAVLGTNWTNSEVVVSANTP